MDRDCQDIINVEFCFIFLRLGSKPNKKMLMMNDVILLGDCVPVFYTL